MDKRELAYAKQTILGVKDWDSFQQALRFYTRLIRPYTNSRRTEKKDI